MASRGCAKCGGLFCVGAHLDLLREAMLSEASEPKARVYMSCSVCRDRYYRVPLGEATEWQCPNDPRHSPDVPTIVTNGHIETLTVDYQLPSQGRPESPQGSDGDAARNEGSEAKCDEE